MVDAKGKASPLVGGDPSNYRNLFAFGDKDGVAEQARLQHPIGVHYVSENQTLYVADSYNHKIKTINLAQTTNKHKIESYIGISTVKNPSVIDGTKDKAQLNEPNGLWKDIKDGELRGLYVADTGNNCIRYVEIRKDGRPGEIRTLEITGIPEVKTEVICDAADGTCKPNF